MNTSLISKFRKSVIIGTLSLSSVFISTSSVVAQETDPDDLELIDDVVLLNLNLSLELGTSTPSGESTAEFQQPTKTIDVELIDRYKNLYKNRATGADYSPSTGTVTFAVTDISVPGNSSLPVELRRWIPADDLRAGGFGDIAWHWDIPMIKANYMARNPLSNNGTIVASDDGWRNGKNCSSAHSTQFLISNRENSYHVDAYKYWSGKQLHIPGKTTDKFLMQTQTDNSIKQVTKSNYYISECIDLASGQEGIIVKGPDGTEYTFGQIRAYLTGDNTYSYNSGATTATKLILVTEIKDRFGNKVTYHYNGQGLLNKITASDGRQIDIEYKTYEFKGKTYHIADTASTNGRTWTYKYGEYEPYGLSTDKRKFLNQVELPNNTSWQYELSAQKLGFSAINRHQYSNDHGVSLNGSANNPGLCEISLGVSNSNSASYPFDTTIINPDGLSTKYEFEVKYHGRAKVNPQTVREIKSSGPAAVYHYHARNLNCTANFSLVRKTVSGQGLTEKTWNYNYSENVGSYLSGNDAFGVDYNSFLDSSKFGFTLFSTPPSTVPDTEDYRTTTVIGPDTKEVYYIDRLFQSPTEGSIVAKDVFDKLGSTLLKRSESSFTKGVYVGEFWFVQSTEFDSPTRLSLNGNMIQHRINKTKERTKLYYDDGTDIFDTENPATSYDDFGFSNKTIESNDLNTTLVSAVRYTKQEYLHDESKWILGLPTKTFTSANSTFSAIPDTEIVYHSQNGHTESTTDYPNLYLPYLYKSFGTWLRRYPEYFTTSVNDEKGRLKIIEYNELLINNNGDKVTGKYRYQLFENYKRGRPQKITMPQRYSDTAIMHFEREINNDGWVTKTTDLNGTETVYGYDTIGRLKIVDLPSLWLDSKITWTQTAGQPITRVAKRCTLVAGDCSGATTYQSTSEFDALYRILSTHENDVANNIHRYQAFEFDIYNNQTFASYPAATATPTLGVHSVYDDLQRLLSNTQDGGGTVTKTYKANNKIAVEDAGKNTNNSTNFNNEQHTTTTTYLAYGSQSYQQATKIESPANITTELNINVLGNITSISQAGTGTPAVSATEYRAYDSQHNLCQIKRDDVGITVLNNNLLGEVQWQAQGQANATNSVCNTSADAGTKISFTYDNLGAQRAISYEGSMPTRTFTLDKNGNIKTIIGDGFTQNYNYNVLDILEDETLIVDGKTLRLDYGYDRLGNLSSILHPYETTPISFAPNAFGQATKAVRDYTDTKPDEVFVKAGASYHPNGIVDTFTYGNDITHKTTLETNGMLRPQCLLDYKGTTVPACGTASSVVNLQYTYDNNSNITSITNGRNSNYSITSLSYDGLDRLKSTIGEAAGIGSSSLTYDGLGNIKSYSNNNLTNGHNFTEYKYNSNNRLEAIIGSQGYDFYQKPTTSQTGRDNNDSYDSRGNVIHNGKRSFTYNLANQMTSSGTNSYVYDGYNRRIKTDDSKGISYSFYSQSGKLLYRETDQGGINYIFLGSKLIAKEGFGVKVPNTTNNETSIANYKPFGDIVESRTDGADGYQDNRDEVGYTGHKFDTDLGLSYMQARYYDPVIGRFYSNDPVGFSNVHNFNRYAYAANNPYKYVDPDGQNFALAVEGFAIGTATCGPVCGAIGGVVLGVGGYLAVDAVVTQMNESSEEQPEIKKQKQDEHKKGTPGHKNRTKQNPGNPPSTWDNPDEADGLTQDAWENGTTDPNNPKVKTLETGRRVGTTGDGKRGQSGVKVHQDNKGKIHGHPYGVDKSQDKT